MSKRFKLSAVLGAFAALGIAAAQPAQAAIVNGGFEAFPDFTGWTTIGDTTIQDQNFKAPPEGTVQAFMTNGGTSVSAASLESFLNLTAGTLSGAGVTNGSAIKQTVNVTAGQIITFKFDFATNEAPASIGNDFGFVTVSNNNLGILADVNSPSVPTNPLEGLNSFATRETGYQSYTIQFNASGSYTLGFGVANRFDTIITSGLLVDDVVQASGPPAGVANLIINNAGGPINGGGGGVTVPLPAAVFIFPLGAAVAGAAGKRLRRKADAE